MLEQYHDAIDFVLMFMMVHEVNNKQQLFADIEKVLKPNGLLLIAEPVFHVSKKNFSDTINIALKTGLKLLKHKQYISICRTVIFSKDKLVYAMES